MADHPWFALGLSLLLVHEMDAVRLREWRMFVWLNTLPDDRGYLYFTALHVPLYFLLFFGLFEARQVVVIGLSVFFIVHVVLHFLFGKHPHYQFHSAFSRVLILGAGVCGAAQLFSAAWPG